MNQHLTDFGKLVQSKMREHGLIDRGWSYDFDRAKKRLGLCNYKSKLITFSLPFVECNTIAAMENTILHECAHALVGPGYGHGHFWQAKAKYIGAKPQACNDDPNIVRPMGDYVFICECRAHYYHRSDVLGTRRRCLICDTVGYAEKTSVVLQTVDNSIIKPRLNTRQLLLAAMEN